jgi:hypothetical protein
MRLLRLDAAGLAGSNILTRLGGKSRNSGRRRAFYRSISPRMGLTMDRRDRELLDKQLGRFQPAPRSDGVMIFAVLAVFLVGMSVGGLIAEKTEPARIASNDTVTGLFVPGAAPVVPQ